MICARLVSVRAMVDTHRLCIKLKFDKATQFTTHYSNAATSFKCSSQSHTEKQAPAAHRSLTHTSVPFSFRLAVVVV